ncbi:Haloacid dehalogenase domain protein hydrolase [Pseudonocardia dioxanivorans CB1190]|uniref:Haloacid dehalogenase domain protein hydrolase n=1 Tax=Pseudonocardia dioxanivorans (strain ATCC 55486 / DSM 44775 / JCM 13855 / CB1190) TaxID=675635 RepID=F4CJJ1_PSEUX|nr:Haloacid dehalogenase domain protein hydrolase [Pseudonocardia dioxanivorans CB1190]
MEGVTTRHGSAPEIVLLDLDGTLVDSAPGILGSLHAAFAELGVEPAPGAVGRHLLGPPLYTTLPAIVGDEETAAQALVTYRRHYADAGLYDCTPYPGIDALLRELSAGGVRLALATSKAEVFAEEVLAHHGWTDLFATITGDSLDARRPTKADVVAEALRRLGAEPGDHVIMVGDRSTDVVGSAAHGIACLGVAWGYAEPGELEEAGALAVVGDATELGHALR